MMTQACMVAGRNSVGYEIDDGLRDVVCAGIKGVVDFGNDSINARLRRHTEFVESGTAARKDFKYVNDRYGFPVVSAQESHLLLNRLKSVNVVEGDTFIVTYEPQVQPDPCRPAAPLNIGRPVDKAARQGQMVFQLSA